MFFDSGLEEAIFENPSGWVRRHYYKNNNAEYTYNKQNLSQTDLQDPIKATELLLNQTAYTYTTGGSKVYVYYSFVRS